MSIRMSIDNYMCIFDSKKYKWLNNNNYHRDYNRPAVIGLNKYKLWYKNGLLHRDYDKLAIIYIEGFE
jgi:hypothetical protein